MNNKFIKRSGSRYGQTTESSEKRLIFANPLRTSEGEEAGQYQEVEGLEKKQKIFKAGEDASAGGLYKEMTNLAELKTLAQYVKAYPDTDFTSIPAILTDDEDKFVHLRFTKQNELSGKLLVLGNNETLAEVRVLSKSAAVNFSNFKNELVNVLGDIGMRDSTGAIVVDDIMATMQTTADTMGLDTAGVDTYRDTSEKYENAKYKLEAAKLQLEDAIKKRDRMLKSNEELDKGEKKWDKALQPVYTLSKWLTGTVGVGGVVTAAALASGWWLALPALTVGLGISAYATKKVTFGWPRFTNRLNNGWVNFRELLTGTVRAAEKGEKTAIKEMKDPKEKLDNETDDLDRNLSMFEKTKDVVQKRLDLVNSQLPAAQRDLFAAQAAGEDLVPKQAAIQALLDQQGRLQKAMRYLNAQVKSIGKLKEDAASKITMEQIERFWKDTNEDGLEQGLKNFVDSTDKKTIEAQKKVAPIDIEEARSELNKLGFDDLKRLDTYFRRAAETEPSKLPANLQVIKDKAPKLFMVIKNIPEMAGDADYKTKVYDDLKKVISETYVDINSVKTNLTRDLKNLLTTHSQRDQLLKASVLQEVAEQLVDRVDGAEEINIAELFPKDFRTPAALSTHIRKEQGIVAIKLVKEMISALSGTSPEIEVKADGSTETSEVMTTRLKGEVNTAFSTLSGDLQAALNNDPGQITSLEFTSDYIAADRTVLASSAGNAATSSNVGEYINRLNPTELVAFKKLLLAMRKHAAVMPGTDTVLPFIDVKKHELKNAFDALGTLPATEGLEGAMDTILRDPVRLEDALRRLQEENILIGRSFSTAFARATGHTYPDHKALITAMTNPQDIALASQILTEMRGHLITTSFDMNDLTVPKLPRNESYFLNLDSTRKDIKEDMDKLLSFAGVASLADIDELNLNSTNDIMPIFTGARVTKGAIGGIQINAASIDDDSVKNKLAHLSYVLHVIVNNLPGGTGVFHVSNPLPNLKIGSTGAEAGYFYKFDGSQIK